MDEGDGLDRPPPHTVFHISNTTYTGPAMLCNLQRNSTLITSYETLDKLILVLLFNSRNFIALSSHLRYHTFALQY